MKPEWPIILSYHHLSDGAASRYVLPATRFEDQLAALLAEGYTPLTLAEALELGPNGAGAAPAKTFSITFDDGLASFATLAVPALDRLGLLHAATAFIPTAFVGRANEWQAKPTTLQRIVPWSDVPEALMTWDEIARVAATGVSIQSHGDRHLAMQGLSYDEALDDAATSKRILGEHGITARFFSLPYGWRSPEAKRAVADAGFDAAVAVKWGGADLFEVRRVPIYGTDGAQMHRLKVSGKYFYAFDAFGRREVRA